MILAAYRARSCRAGNPSIIINSIDLTKTLALAANDLDALTDYMVAEVDTLVRAGADFAVMSLSDRLKPWSVIERRLRAVAVADLVLAIYNPASRARPDQIAMARFSSGSASA